jgi:hypothetical protein
VQVGVLVRTSSGKQPRLLVAMRAGRAARASLRCGWGGPGGKRWPTRMHRWGMCWEEDREGENRTIDRLVP